MRHTEDHDVVVALKCCSLYCLQRSAPINSFEHQFKPHTLKKRFALVRWHCHIKVDFKFVGRVQKPCVLVKDLAVAGDASDRINRSKNIAHRWSDGSERCPEVGCQTLGNRHQGIQTHPHNTP